MCYFNEHLSSLTQRIELYSIQRRIKYSGCFFFLLQYKITPLENGVICFFENAFCSLSDRSALPPASLRATVADVNTDHYKKETIYICSVVIKSKLREIHANDFHLWINWCNWPMETLGHTELLWRFVHQWTPSSHGVLKALRLCGSHWEPRLWICVIVKPAVKIWHHQPDSPGICSLLLFCHFCLLKPKTENWKL